MSFIAELKRRNVIRVGLAYVLMGWVLLQAADFALDLIDAPNWIVQSLSVLALLGLPIALFVAWAFELTPEGIKREEDVDRSASVVSQTGRKLDRAIIFFLVLVVLGMGLERFYISGPEVAEPGVVTAPMVPDEPADPRAETERSIAVLPFVNMSADPDNEYFSDGVSEEILNVLSAVSGLKVTARTSAFSFKESTLTVAEIAQQLGVEHVLEGSVRKSGNQVRVTAQLIKAGDDFHLWSETYDRELDNIFAIQDEIAGKIAEQLKVSLALAPQQDNFTGTTNTQAYDAYLRGISQWHLRTGDSLRNATALFEQAIELDPEFARAWAGLALTHAVSLDYMDVPMSVAHSNTRAAANRALELDPENIEAATALIYSSDDVDEQLERARQAIALNPSFATTHQWYATSLMMIGDLDAAQKEYAIAKRLDPRSRVISMNYAYLFMARGEWNIATAIVREMLSFAPDYDYAHSIHLELMLRMGNREGALRAAQGAVAVMGRDVDRTEVYLDLYFNPQQRDAAAAEIFSWHALDWWDPANPALTNAYSLPALLAGAGAFDLARELLEIQIATMPNYSFGITRTNYSIPEFICRDDVQALFDSTALPPLKVPYPCEELLAWRQR